MTNFVDVDNYSSDIPSVDATSCFETVNMSSSTKNGIIDDGGYEFGSYDEDEHSDDEDEHSDDEDGHSEMRTKSTDQNTIAIPPNDITVENSLSKELMKLSVNDRTAIEEEIHGVAGDTEETPEFLASCLHKFDNELMTLKNSMRRFEKRKQTQQMENSDVDSSRTHGDEDFLRNVIRISPDYEEEEEEDSTDSTMRTSGDESELKRSCYVNDPKVRLRFVRAERYDSKKAAKRFVKFLKFTQELYGNFVADRPIQLSDLKTREEKRALANVSFQFLPFRDRSGRRVFVAVGTCGYDIEPKLRIKVMWYMYWIASEDTESQRKGVIVIGWPSEDNIWEQSLRSSIKNHEGVYQNKVFNGLPMRVAGVHSCFDDHPIYKIVISLFYFALDPYLKAKFKVHTGKRLLICRIELHVVVFMNFMPVPIYNCPVLL